MIERTTIRLPKDLLALAKRKAVAEGRTLTALIEEGLRRVVAEPHNLKPPKRLMPRVSKAGGGLNPQFSWDKLSSEVQEMDDRECTERLKRGYE